jgi:NAD(P)H-hydrate epimerase
MKSFNKIFNKRRKDTNKSDYGRVFILAGSEGMTGAAYLCSQAAIVSGCGLVTLGIPRGLNDVMAAKISEVMTLPLPQTNRRSFHRNAAGAILRFCGAQDIVALGCGISRDKSTRELIRYIVPRLTVPLVIDADGLNALSEDPGIFKKIRKHSVITPHPGEFSRISSKSIERIQSDRKRLAKRFADEYNITVVLKGSRTVVASPEKRNVYVNSTGNPGIASAGCGDVLTGVIAAFMAQGLEAFTASKAAVFAHGAAGDLAADRKGQISVIASDIIDKLPDAIKTIS